MQVWLHVQCALPCKASDRVLPGQMANRVVSNLGVGDTPHSRESGQPVGFIPFDLLEDLTAEDRPMDEEAEFALARLGKKLSNVSSCGLRIRIL